MGRDAELVILFLEEYNAVNGTNYQVNERPEDLERNKPAVEAIAIDGSGRTLALEHTLIQPFVGEKDDAQPFLTALGEIEKEQDIALPQHLVTIAVHVGAIPKGVDWKEVSRTVRAWLRASLNEFPMGPSEQIVPNLSFELKLGVDRMTFQDDKGKLSFSRYVPADSLSAVMTTAMKKKLPKLANAVADEKILLVEEDSPYHAYNTIHEKISTVGKQFRELKKLKEIWLLDTTAWKTENYIGFARVWPDLAFSRQGNLRIIGMAEAS